MKYIKHIILTAFVMVMTANVWAQNPVTPEHCTSDPNSWCFQMPLGNYALRTTWKQDALLAWKVGAETVTVESNPLVAYLGFPFEGATLTAAYNDILGEVSYSIAHRTGTNSGNTVSADGVVTINGVGIDTVKAVFAGNDTLAPDSAMYIIDTRAPYTLTLATNDPAMGTVKIDSAGGSGEKTIIPYDSIQSDSCSRCNVCWPGEGSDKLFDGNISSGKWATDSTVKFVVFHTNTPVQVNGYTLFTGNDNASEHGRNPKSWVLKAKLASTDSWTTVATVTDDHTMQDVNYTPFDFEMDVPGTYQYFRFEVSALRGSGNFMQLGEMQLFKRAISFLDSVSVKDAAANEYYVLPGAKVAVKAIPAAGYQLLKWEDNSTDLDRTVTVTSDTTALATFGLPTPGVTPEGNLTVFGGRFVSETGEIVATPALTETGEFIDESVVPVPVPVFTCGTSTVTDYDGNTYNTVQIGSQCWMKENMRTTHYADGNDVPAGGSNTSSTAPYYYDYSSSDIPLEQRGYLYNWLAAMHGAASSAASPSGVQGICPNGWHLPSDAEWTTMTNYVNSQSAYRCDGTSNNIAKALASKEGWNTTNTDDCMVGKDLAANNETGFSAVPAGNYYSSFGNAGNDAYFWSATQSAQVIAYYRDLCYSSASVVSNNSNKGNGFSVRCLRD